MNGKKHTREQLNHYIAQWIKVRDDCYDYVRKLIQIDKEDFNGKIPEPPELKKPPMPR
jgi:hypothetical protein